MGENTWHFTKLRETWWIDDDIMKSHSSKLLLMLLWQFCNNLKRRELIRDAAVRKHKANLTACFTSRKWEFKNAVQLVVRPYLFCWNKKQSIGNPYCRPKIEVTAGTEESHRSNRDHHYGFHFIWWDFENIWDFCLCSIAVEVEGIDFGLYCIWIDHTYCNA